MNLTAKETSLLKDLRSQEQLCVDKYSKYAAEACDCQLKELFTQRGRNESQHIQTLDQIASGAVPQMSGSQASPALPPQTPGTCSAQDRQKDAFLCSDALATEKHVSSGYNTCIFEFSDTNVRDALNHIQKEEQQHGELIYEYMSQHGMYS